MNDVNKFRENAHLLVDWMADYLESVDKYPVKSQVKPGDILRQLPEKAPLEGEHFDQIFKDFKDIILPGITHWQSPSFHAYFPGNSSFPSLLGEMLTSTLAAQCMIWETSPSAAELEERVLDWLKKAMKLPEGFQGVIQDTASTATLSAILTAREQASNFGINESGFEVNKYRIYCSVETHSSIEKAVKIAGFGRANLVKVAVDQNLRMIPGKLKKAIDSDKASGFVPVCVVASIGTTGTCAIDPLREIGKITTSEKIWLHVDAAYAGTAMLLEEFRWMLDGIEYADSYVFNPHKWMFTNFDCTAYYVRDAEALIRTFEVLPEYLKTRTRGQVNDYRDWGIPLGRRFRALKLWFVIRSYGIKGIQEKLRNHIWLAEYFETKITSTPDFEILSPRTLNLVCFRYNPDPVEGRSLDELNHELLDSINQSGKAYLTHTKIDDKYAIRMVIGQTNVTQSHIDKTWSLIQKLALSLVKTHGQSSQRVD